MLPYGSGAPVLKMQRGITVWVTARHAFGIAMDALRGHKLRSFLTLLGVVIATTTLIVVMSVVNGMNVYIAEHIANLARLGRLPRTRPIVPGEIAVSD